MNELKTNKAIIRRDSALGRNTSYVSTYVRREEKTYVKSYAMTKKRRLEWIDNHMNGDDDGVLYPARRKFKAEEAASDPKTREKARILMICVGIALVMLLIIPAIKIATDYLVIDEIRVEGSTIYSERELLGAIGVSMGDGLPLLSRSKAETAVLTKLPYIQSCKISFELPNVLIFDITDEAPAVYAEVLGEYYILTSSLRILERVEDAESVAGLLRIELPNATRAVVGEEIIFEGTSNVYITDFFKLINDSALKNRLGIVYFDKKFDIVASVDGKFRVLFGSPMDMELKIETVAKLIEENADDCISTGIIDVRVPDVCGIVLDSGADPNARE